MVGVPWNRLRAPLRGSNGLGAVGRDLRVHAQFAAPRTGRDGKSESYKAWERCAQQAPGQMPS